MGKIWDLVKSERIKLVSINKIIVCSLIFIIVLLAYSFIFEPVSESEWKQNAREIKEAQVQAVEILQEQIEVADSETKVQYNSAIKICKDTIAKIEYCLDNDIVYNPANGWFFLYKIELILPALILFCIFMGSKSISIENENRTWKNVFSSGNSLKHILVAKIISMVMLVIEICLLVTAIAFVIGFFRFGVNGNQMEIVEMENGIIQQHNMIIHYFANISISLIKIYFCLFCFFAITFTGIGEKVALGISLGVYLFSFVASNVVVSERIESALPFKYLAFKSEDINGIKDLCIFIGVMLVYFIIFWMVSVWGVKKKTVEV